MGLKSNRSQRGTSINQNLQEHLQLFRSCRSFDNLWVILPKPEETRSGTFPGTLYGIEILPQACILCSFLQFPRVFLSSKMSQTWKLVLLFIKNLLCETGGVKDLKTAEMNEPVLTSDGCDCVWNKLADICASFGARCSNCNNIDVTRKNLFWGGNQMIYKEALGLLFLCTNTFFWKHSENVCVKCLPKKVISKGEVVFLSFSYLEISQGSIKTFVHLIPSL